MLLNEKIQSGQLLESQSEGLPTGVLAKVKYIVCDIGVKNFNKRVYEKKVWENVLADKEIKECLKNRNLWCHSEHPQGSAGSSTEKIAGIISEMYIDEKENKFIQVMEVLDTPYGRIVEALLRANCSVGVSSRAEGEIKEEIDENKQKYYRVIPESYKYITTDWTANPSNVSSNVPLDVKMNIVKEVANGVNSHKVDRDDAVTMLEGIDIPESRLLMESITKAKSHNCKNGACTGCGCHSEKNEGIKQDIQKIESDTKKIKAIKDELLADIAKWNKEDEENVKKNESITDLDKIELDKAAYAGFGKPYDKLSDEFKKQARMHAELNRKHYKIPDDEKMDESIDSEVASLGKKFKTYVEDTYKHAWHTLSDETLRDAIEDYKRKNESRTIADLIKAGDIVTVDGIKSIVHQVFETTKKCIISQGIVRKTVNISEVKAIDMFETIRPFWKNQVNQIYFDSSMCVNVRVLEVKIDGILVEDII